MRFLALLGLCFSCCILGAGPARAQTPAPDRFAGVRFEQRLGQHLPLDVSLRDEAGAPVPLRTFFHGQPVLLVFAYYDCPSLCTVVLNGLLNALRDIRLEAGRDYQIVVVSIRPGDSTTLAAEKQKTYATRYGRPGSAHGWHFLTGGEAAIQQLTAAAGYHYFHDAASDQYAHPSGLVVVTPDGTLSRYFLGIEFPPAGLHTALVEAGRQHVGSLSQALLLLCFHYDPHTGRYTLAITRLLQIAGLGTVLVLGLLMVRMSRHRRARLAQGAPAFLAFHLAPARASDLAQPVDAIFYSLLVLCGLLTLGIFAATLYFCIRYRAGSRAPRQAHQRSTAVEITWTSLTFAVFVVLFVWAAVVYFRMARPPGNAVEMHVVAKQWMWKIQHPDGRREINELHLLVGQPVRLVMTSQDVIHDFYVPAFRTKQDVLPGRYTTEWFTPTLPGRYHLFCAEYCGTDHSHMGGWIDVLEPAAYSRWLAEQPAAESLAAAGGRLFIARGCSGCHAPNGQIPAPLLDGIYGKPVALSDGTTVIADDQYLHDSILLPNKQIAGGYEARMPTFQGQLSEDEVMELVAYIKSLGAKGGARP